MTLPKEIISHVYIERQTKKRTHQFNVTGNIQDSWHSLIVSLIKAILKPLKFTLMLIVHA